MLANFSRTGIRAIIEALMMSEYLYKTDGPYPLLGITETGRIAIVRNYLLQNDNADLQHFVYAKTKGKDVFKRTIPHLSIGNDCNRSLQTRQ